MKKLNDWFWAQKWLLSMIYYNLLFVGFCPVIWQERNLDKWALVATYLVGNLVLLSWLKNKKW
jgi:hypothetical protein